VSSGTTRRQAGGKPPLHPGLTAGLRRSGGLVANCKACGFC
jgi:hypothetical protein